jgi:hypothetical protein
MMDTRVSQRHRILIAAAVAAVLGERARVREIAPTAWAQKDRGLAVPAPRATFHRVIKARVRTARKEKT